MIFEIISLNFLRKNVFIFLIVLNHFQNKDYKYCNAFKKNRIYSNYYRVSGIFIRIGCVYKGHLDYFSETYYQRIVFRIR